MARHSYIRCWLHVVWCTQWRTRMFSRDEAARVSAWLARYAAAKGIYQKINFVNPEHVHVLIDLPAGLSIDQAVKLLKGASSHWINETHLVSGQFSWARGYGAFSVSQSNVSEVANYIAGQEEHHRIKTWDEEFRAFVKRHGLRWCEEDAEETVETVSPLPSAAKSPN